MFIYVLLLLSFSDQHLQITGEGHFATEAECQKVAEQWRAHAVAGVPIEPLCVATR
jgi:hypothetical protein